MGRFGGRELGLGSDLDVMFVHDPLPGADDEEASRHALLLATELRRLLDACRPRTHRCCSMPTCDRKVAAVRWSAPWPPTGVLPAVVVGLGEPGAAARPAVAGDADRRRGLHFDLIDRLRWPAGGLHSMTTVTEIRRIKARVESERLPRGADPALHTKLGPGGLADVEWTVQLLQLQHRRPRSESCGPPAPLRHCSRGARQASLDA